MTAATPPRFTAGEVHQEALAAFDTVGAEAAGDGSERCQCPCAVWRHGCCAGPAAAGVSLLYGGQRVGLGVCRPCLAELARALPAAALRQVS